MIPFMKTTTLSSKNSTNRPSCPLALLLIPLAFVCFALLPQAQAVCQEGCLTNQNTVLGEDALFSNTTGGANTAIGFDAHVLNTTGSYNTATGNFALLGNTTGSDNTATGFFALEVNTTGVQNTATVRQTYP